MSDVQYRDLTGLEDFKAVVDLERRIWGPDYADVVPVPILAVTVRRGAILVGAFAGDRLIGFVYSFPALKDGRPTQWSDMLGVADDHRGRGIGRRLKLLQRERALAMGVELIEWTFDPLQAINAHLNLAKLGVEVREYEQNIYGESASPLHRGSPTDRFLAEWWIRHARVENRIHSGGRSQSEADLLPGAHSIMAARASGEWLEPDTPDFSRTEAMLAVEIPTGFTEMLSRAPERAMAWRLATRDIFTTYFARGYRIVDFHGNRGRQKGLYLLTNR
jgi:predicted GNAT superfamily acetyltransferase